MKLACLQRWNSPFCYGNKEDWGDRPWQSEPETHPYSDDNRSAIPALALKVNPDNVMYVNETVQQVIYCSKPDLWPIIIPIYCYNKDSPGHNQPWQTISSLHTVYISNTSLETNDMQGYKVSLSDNRESAISGLFFPSHRDLMISLNVKHYSKEK